MMACEHLKALNFAKQGQWNEAHELVQPYSDRTSCLIHAYLHRVEGDLSNANYWYSRASSMAPNISLDQELEQLYALLAKL